MHIKGVGCGEQDPGYCEVCEDGTFSIGYACNCTNCRAPCSNDSLAAEYESYPCRPMGDRECSPCTSLPTCAEGKYRRGCAAQSPGECTSCTNCPIGQQRQGCAGLSPGVCVSCPSGMYNPDSADSTRAPIRYLDWRIRTTAPSTEWRLGRVVLRLGDTAGSRLVVPLQDALIISSPLLAYTHADSALLQPLNTVRLGRDDVSSSFFVGWGFASPTAVADIEILQAEPLPDSTYPVEVQGRNRADFTGRLAGACADRAHASPGDLSRQELMKYTAAAKGLDVAAAECLHLCQTLLRAVTGCEFVDGEGCYAHTSTLITKADGSAGRFCWLAKPLEWHTIMSANFPRATEALTISISKLTRDHGCMPCLLCDGEHEHVAVSCNASADAVCGSCSALECRSSGLIVTAIGDQWRQGCGHGLQGKCVTCAGCDVALARSHCLDEDSGTCIGCPLGTFSLADMPTCDPCTECNASQYIERSCAATQDRVCKECSVRAAELACPSGSYLANCGDGFRNKGRCLPCAACAPGSYRANCRDLDPGTCVTCQNGTFSDSYSSAPACTACAPKCVPGLVETRECTALQDRICAPAECTECPPGFFIAGCHVSLSLAGSCQPCASCALGERRLGCGGLSKGMCQTCPTRSFQPNKSSASMCLPCNEQSCADDEFELSECSATADRQCSACSHLALACAQGSYLEGCGGGLPGACTACPPCEAGNFRTSCHGTSAGECSACPHGSFHPGTGYPLACHPCTSSCKNTGTTPAASTSNTTVAPFNPTTSTTPPEQTTSTTAPEPTTSSSTTPAPLISSTPAPTTTSLSQFAAQYIVAGCTRTQDTTCGECGQLTCKPGFYRVDCGLLEKAGECKQCAICSQGT